MNQPPTFEPFVPARPKGQVPAEQTQPETTVKRPRKPIVAKPPESVALQEANQRAAEANHPVSKKPRKKREKKERKVAMSAAFKIAATLKADDLPFFESFREAFDKLSTAQRRRIWEALAELYR